MKKSKKRLSKHLLKSVCEQSPFPISENALSVIFQFLSLAEIIQMSKSNKFFAVAAWKLMSSLHVVCKSIFAFIRSKQRLISLLSRCSLYLKHLDLSGVACLVSDDTLKQLTACCTQLTSVCLHGCAEITDAALIALLAANHNVRNLTVSGCKNLTCAIGEALSRCLKLFRLNLAWCPQIDANIVPFLLFLNANGSLIEVNLHCCHKFVSLFHSFAHCLNSLDKRRPNGSGYKLKSRLFMIGGLQKSTTNEQDFEKHVEFLRGRNIEYCDFEFRSLFDYDFERKLGLLLASKRIISSKYRIFTVCRTSKVYLVLPTENGIFGIKLSPSLDLKNEVAERFIAKMKERKQCPLKWLKQECNAENWDWKEDFQAKRNLSMLGMEESANWIHQTVSNHCPCPNASF